MRKTLPHLETMPTFCCKNMQSKLEVKFGTVLRSLERDVSLWSISQHFCLLMSCWGDRYLKVAQV